MYEQWASNMGHDENDVVDLVRGHSLKLSVNDLYQPMLEPNSGCNVKSVFVVISYSK